MAALYIRRLYLSNYIFKVVLKEFRNKIMYRVFHIKSNKYKNFISTVFFDRYVQKKLKILFLDMKNNKITGTRY